ncbi:MAG: aminotransferase class I and II, partial [Flavobacterium sp.]
MLIWHKDLWLIDHGASFYFHHSFTDPKGHAVVPFSLIKDHVLLPQASKLTEVDAEFKAMLTADTLRSIVNLLPDEWLQWEGMELTPDEIRDVYFDFLVTRLENSDIFIKQAQHARQALI